jgi:hypothetical protein
MICYLSTPGSLAHAQACAGAPVLLSFAYATPWVLDFARAFGRVLWDSGAYSTFNSGKVIDLDDYAETARSLPWADGAACLDSIKGDWREGLANWDRYPWQFPVYHDTDPPEALDAILERLQDSGRARFRDSSPQWVGLGMTPPRNSRRWLAETLARLPPALHVHGFAMRGHADLITEYRGADCSADSINWWLDSRKVAEAFPWLTPVECVEIIVKRYTREFRTRPERAAKAVPQLGLDFENAS